MSTDVERYARMHAVFDGARRLEAPAREAFLDEQCGDDETLRTDVLALIAAAADDTATSDGFSETRIAASRQALERMFASGRPDAAWLPERIAGYQVIRRLGEGGMGVVYEAMQASPRRRVAIKLLHPMQATQDRLRRLRHEAELLGRLRHPGIAQVVEAGTYDLGREAQPFFAMELVDGVDLRTYCERENLDVRDRIELLARVGDAVQYAHDKGVVHRDLKPENIFVDEHGQPKVLDFGIARATDGSTLITSRMTQDGQLLGTLAYMAPEQLRGEREAITPRTDVYGLGVVGFELITRQLPFDVTGVGLATAVRLLQEQDAPSLGTIDGRWRGDLEAIIRHAIEKDPATRYPSAAAFAADMRRFLRHEPVLARPPSYAYRLRKLAHKNRGLVAAVLAVMLSLTAGLGWALVEQHRADRRATERAAQAYRADLVVAAEAANEGRMTTARQFLSDAPEALRDWAWRYLDARLGQSVRRFDEPAGRINDLTVSADGRTFLTAGRDGTLLHRSVSSGSVLQTIRVPGVVLQCAISADGRQAVAIGATPDEPDCHIWIATWSLQDGRQLDYLDLERPEPPGPTDGWGPLAQADVDRRRLLTQAFLRAYLLDPREIAALKAISSLYMRPALSPSGRYLVIVDDPLTLGGEIEILDAATLTARGTLAGYHDAIVGMAISPDETRLATVAMDGGLQVWDLAAATSSPAVGQALITVDAQQGEIRNVVFTEDGTRLVTAGGNRTIRVWDARTGAPLVELPSQEDRIIELDIVPGADEIVSVSDRGSVRFWSVGELNPAVLRGHHSFVYAVDIDRELGLILSGGWDGYEGKPGAFRLWDLESGDPVAAWGDSADQFVSDAAFLPGQKAVLTLAAGTISSESESRITRLDLTTGSRRLVARFDVPVVSLRPSRTPGTAWTLTQGPTDTCVRLLDLGTGAFTSRGRTFARGRAMGRVEHPLAVSPSERLLAVAIDAGQLKVVRAEDLSVVHDLPVQGAELLAVAFDAKGRRLLSCSNDGTVRVWDIRTGREIAVLAGHDAGVLCAEFNPAGTRIATGSRDGTLRIWSGESYEQLVSFTEHERYIYELAWQDDGERILTASGDHTVRIWETQPIRKRHAAHRERQALVEQLAPRVDAWLARQPDAGFGSFLDEATGLNGRERQVARQILLGRRLGTAPP